MQALHQLAQALQRTLHPAERARLELRLAAIAARQGRFEESLATVERLRAALAAGELASQAETVGWMHLVEGLVALHRAPDTASPAALLRAQALARLAPGTELPGLVSAWLAHLHFNQGRLAEFAALASQAQALACGATETGPHGPAALARVALTVASAWMSAGQEAAAQAWFGCAREQAAAAGDSLLMAGVLHDRAAFGVHNLRVRWALSDPAWQAPVSPELARLQLDASRNYEAAVRAQALAELQPLARIALLVVQGRHQEALGWTEQTLPRLAAAGLGRYDAMLRADRLWCQVALQRSVDALAESAAIETRLVHTPDPDDRLIVQATLARALDASGHEDRARHHAQRALGEEQRMRAAWAQLAAALREHDLAAPGAVAAQACAHG